MRTDQVFSIRRGPDRKQLFKVVVDDTVLDAEWPDMDSAMAGLRVEQARRARAKADTETQETNDG